jgi:hypothetical protein
MLVQPRPFESKLLSPIARAQNTKYALSSRLLSSPKFLSRLSHSPCFHPFLEAEKKLHDFYSCIDLHQKDFVIATRFFLNPALKVVIRGRQ